MLGPYYISQIFMLLISNGEMILSNVNLLVRGQVKIENSSFPVAVRDSKTRVLKFPNVSVLFFKFRGTDPPQSSFLAYLVLLCHRNSLGAGIPLLLRHKKHSTELAKHLKVARKA